MASQRRSLERIAGVASRLPRRRCSRRSRESCPAGSSSASWRYSRETWLSRKTVATAVSSSEGSATVVLAISSPETATRSSAGYSRARRGVPRGRQRLADRLGQLARASRRVDRVRLRPPFALLGRHQAGAAELALVELLEQPAVAGGDQDRDPLGRQPLGEDLGLAERLAVELTSISQMKVCEEKPARARASWRGGRSARPRRARRRRPPS